MTIRVTYKQLGELIEMAKGKSGKKFKKEKKQKIKYPKKDLFNQVKKIRRKQGFSSKK